MNLLQQEDLNEHKRTLEEQQQRQQAEAEERERVAEELEKLESKIMCASHLLAPPTPRPRSTAAASQGSRAHLLSAENLSVPCWCGWCAAQRTFDASRLPWAGMGASMSGIVWLVSKRRSKNTRASLKSSRPGRCSSSRNARGRRRSVWRRQHPPSRSFVMLCAAR